jgi:hypothetical protein
MMMMMMMIIIIIIIIIIVCYSYIALARPPQNGQEVVGSSYGQQTKMSDPPTRQQCWRLATNYRKRTRVFCECYPGPRVEWQPVVNGSNSSKSMLVYGEGLLSSTFQSLYSVPQLSPSQIKHHGINTYGKAQIFQYNETNVMRFSFNLLRIKGPYMFRALLAHPQEALHKLHLVYCVRIMSVGWGTVAVKLQPCLSLLTLYARNIPMPFV